MIVLDTHVWIWWVHDDPLLPPDAAQVVASHESAGLGISAISCWEVAKLVEYNRLALPLPVSDWIKQALSYPGIQLLDLTPEITIESTQLPQPFHKDPADQLIVATARIHGVPLATFDARIRSRPHVEVLP